MGFLVEDAKAIILFRMGGMHIGVGGGGLVSSGSSSFIIREVYLI